jgi:hypothetical protein
MVISKVIILGFAGGIYCAGFAGCGEERECKGLGVIGERWLYDAGAV